MANLSPNRSAINYLKTGSNYTNQKTKIVRVDFKKNKKQLPNYTLFLKFNDIGRLKVQSMGKYTPCNH